MYIICAEILLEGPLESQTLSQSKGESSKFAEKSIYYSQSWVMERNEQRKVTIVILRFLIEGSSILYRHMYLYTALVNYLQLVLLLVGI